MHAIGSRIRTFVGALLVSWFVLATALWLLAGPTGREVVALSVALTLLSALVIWWVSGRVPLPTSPRPAFLGFHALLGLWFGSGMILVTYWARAFMEGTTLREAWAQSPFLGGEFVFWIWLYALLAAGSYGSRYRTELVAQREVTARAKARAAEARLETLRGQLNPHFLFNALHGVAALVRHDPPRAELAIERLGDLLRFSLDEAGDTMVDLSSELEFTRTYLELERLGLSSRLQVEYDIDESVLDTEVPPFAVQVLAENAVRHGITPLPQGGRIRIAITDCTDAVEIAVSDNGTGKAVVGHDKGRGLENLRHRLSAYYGSAASLEAAARPEGGFLSKVRIPKR